MATLRLTTAGSLLGMAASLLLSQFFDWWLQEDARLGTTKDVLFNFPVL